MASSSREGHVPQSNAPALEPEMLDLWYGAAERLTAHLFDDHTAKGRAGVAGILWPAAEVAESLVRAAGGTWDDSVRLGMAEAFHRRRRDPNGSEDWKSSIWERKAAHALRVGHAVATGAVADLSRTDAILAIAALSGDARFADASADLDRVVAAATPRIDGLEAEIAFTFTYTQSPGYVVPCTGTGHLPIGRHEGEAPVAQRLRRPDGGELVIRDVDGRPYRPLLKPGSWESATLGDVIEGLSGRGGWRDDPTAARLPAHEPALPATEAAPKHADGRMGARQRNAAQRECIERATGLLLIDGVVHRPTTWPRLHAASLTGPKRRLFLGWGVDDLRSWQSMAPVGAASDMRVIDTNGFANSPLAMGLPVPDEETMATLLDAWTNLVERQWPATVDGPHAFAAPSRPGDLEQPFDIRALNGDAGDGEARTPVPLACQAALPEDVDTALGEMREGKRNAGLSTALRLVALEALRARDLDDDRIADFTP